MCERLPFPNPELRFERRALLAAAGGIVLGACTAPGLRKLQVPVAAPPSEAPPDVVPLERGNPPAPKPPKPAYEIVSRARWQAEPMRDDHDPMARITRLTLHHTHTLEDMADRTDVELMRAIQVLHQDTRGWADIGYHFVVGRDGLVYEGRPLDVQGAHAGAENNIENVGISVIGSFTDELPAPRQQATMELLLTDLATRYAIAPDQLFGHRDLKETECPGDALYAWFLQWKAARRA